MKMILAFLFFQFSLLTAQQQNASPVQAFQDPEIVLRQGDPAQATTSPTVAGRPDVQHGTPLGAYLNADGTLHTPRGFRGILDPAGYRMTTGRNGEPVFVRTGMATASDPEDLRWDDRFAFSGILPNGQLKVVAVQGPDIYIGGGIQMAGGIAVNNIAKWNGANWDSLGGGVNSNVYALAVNDSEVFAAGYFTTAGGVPANRVAKWDGTSWSALGSGVNKVVYSLALKGSELYVGGYFDSAGGAEAQKIAKWDGSTWSALGSGINDIVFAITAGDSGVYVAGRFDTAGGVAARNIAKWDGANWSPLGAGVSDEVYTLAFMGSDLYVGGYFDTAGSVLVNKIAKWDGSTWSPLGSGFPAYTDYIQSLAVVDTTLYAGGEFTSAGGVPANNVAAWDGSTWSAMDAGTDNDINWLAASGSTLYAAGYFSQAGNVAVSGFASWDGAAWSATQALGGLFGTNGSVINCLAVMDSVLYAGGQFTIAGITAAKNIAMWDGTNWSALGSGVNSQVNALAVSGSDLYVGGNFTQAGEIPASRIARWDGTTWDSLGSGIGYVVLAIAVSDTNVYVGGSFATAGGAPASNIARWDGSTWSALGSGTTNGVLALAVRDSILYAGGAFSHAGGVLVNSIAQWDGSTWAALGTGMTDTSFTPEVWSLAISDSFLYAGGKFTTAGGTGASHIARWDGSSWSGLGSGLNGKVYTIAAVGNDVYAGGYFDIAGGESASNIATWDGTAWSALGSGTNGTVVATAGFYGDLFVGGYFTAAGAKPSSHIAVWKGLGTTVDITLNGNWNLLSLPVYTADMSVATLFPDAVSQAFKYSAGYVVSPDIEPGIGYWLKYPPGGGAAEIQGAQLTTLDVSVQSGWNLIGSISFPVSTASITSQPPGMITGNFFAYNGTYVTADTIEPGKAYWVKTAGSGTLRLTSGSIATASGRAIKIVPTSELPPSPPDDLAEGTSGEGIPKTFGLDQNYPNPFNPATRITYQLPVESRVTLKVYNIVGQVVATLIDGNEHAGFKSVIWDAEGVASGIYYYRMDAIGMTGTGTSHVQVKRMILIK